MTQAPPVSGADRRYMARATTHHVSNRGHVGVDRRRRSPRFAGTLSMTQGTVLAAVVAWDGTAFWRIARVLAVLALTAVVVWRQRPDQSGSASPATLAWGAVG